MAVNVVPVSEARTRLTELVSEADNEEITLLKHGHPVAVLLSSDGFERLISHIEDLEDENSVLRAQLNPDSIPLEQAMAEIGMDDDG